MAVHELVGTPHNAAEESGECVGARTKEETGAKKSAAINPKLTSILASWKRKSRSGVGEESEFARKGVRFVRFDANRTV